MKTGDWVHVAHGSVKVTGFIVGMTEQQALIQVTVPGGMDYLSVYKTKVIMGDETLWMDDIPPLIDLALSLRDQEWFERLAEESSLWKGVDHMGVSGK